MCVNNLPSRTLTENSKLNLHHRHHFICSDRYNQIKHTSKYINMTRTYQARTSNLTLILTVSHSSRNKICQQLFESLVTIRQVMGKSSPTVRIMDYRDKSLSSEPRKWGLPTTEMRPSHAVHSPAWDVSRCKMMLSGRLLDQMQFQTSPASHILDIGTRTNPGLLSGGPLSLGWTWSEVIRCRLLASGWFTCV